MYAGYTLDEIKPLCEKLFDAIRNDKQLDAANAALELLSGFLCDINKLAWFAEQISMNTQNKS